MKCLEFSLLFIEDERLCYHSAYCFQILMESMGTIKDSQLIINLIEFYQNKHFPKDTIIEQLLSGIISVIVKLNNEELILGCLKKLLDKLYSRMNGIALDHPHA